ncbi:MAG: SpoIIE family protein phosphatase [Christensenellales bacterium]|nr:SpoIIE family protein phosphatase [Clostridia bacterium]HRU83798.1 SpoIIE family protein phosphatase [Eubacteriales bacterium]
MKRKIDYAAVAKYITYFLIFVLLHNAKTKSGLTPFALGFFAALVYSRENLWLLAPLYVLGSFTAGVSWQGLVIAATPAVVFAIAYFVHYKIKKPVNLLFLNIYALICQAPYVAFSAVSLAGAMDAVLTVIIAQLFTYTSTVVVYAIKVRGINYKFSVDEAISAEVVLAVFSLSVWCLNFYGFSPFFGAAAFVILAAAASFPFGTALALGAVLGIGAAFSSGSLIMTAVLALWAVAASSLKTKTMIFSAVAIVAVDLLAGYYFKAYPGGYSYLNLISLAIGLAAYFVLPKRTKQFLASVSKTFRDTYSSRTLVNKSRERVAERLVALSKVFTDMSALLSGDNLSEIPMSGGRRLAKDIGFKVCGRCDNAENCAAALGGDISCVLEPVAEVVLDSGRATMLNMPPFITSRCKKIPELIAALNRGVLLMAEWDASRESIDHGRKMIADEMAGVGELLCGLASDVKRRLAFDAALEKRLIDELSYHNVIASEAAVYGEEEKSATLVVRETDAGKPALIRILNRVLGASMELEYAADAMNGWQTLHFKRAPAFEAVFGAAREKKPGNAVSGDTVSFERIGDVLVMSLSDGMGSGEEAHRASAAALSLIENFYRAGFGNEVVMSLSNRMLSLVGGESFSTLDIAAVNLKSGAVDLIKLGSADGIIKSGGKLEIIESKGLPVGILDKITPAIERRTLSHGDIIVMVSDGVVDALGNDRLLDIISSETTLNPQVLADAVLDAAKSFGLRDDATALALRLV